VNYWQIGSGAGDREYWQECLDFGMAFVGHKETMEKVRKDDIVVMRKGAKEIVAVGKVIEHQGESVGFADEDKNWLRDFDGWDLPAYCYVEWHKPPDPLQVREQLAQRAICRLNKPGIRECADQILSENPPYPSERGGPPPTQRVTDEEIEDFLGQKGLSPEDAKVALSIMNDIRSLVNHYYEFGYQHWDEVKEHEIRTFLIVPLLLALGWDEQQIKIELSSSKLGVAGKRGSIDVACFSANYRPGDKEVNRNNCKLIIESKRFSSGITRRAPKQAKGYAEGLPNCEVVLASNGYCYKAFTRDGAEGFSEQPSAYLNLRMPKREYPLDPSVGGALRVLELLLPRS
jgi:hypothetical protein